MMTEKSNKPISTFNMIRKSFTYFKKSFSVNIGFKAIYKGLTAFIFVPLLI